MEEYIGDPEFSIQAKALAEKNERDMQMQRDQAERHVSLLVR